MKNVIHLRSRGYQIDVSLLLWYPGSVLLISHTIQERVYVRKTWMSHTKREAIRTSLEVIFKHPWVGKERRRHKFGAGYIRSGITLFKLKIIEDNCSVFIIKIRALSYLWKPRYRETHALSIHHKNQSIRVTLDRENRALYEPQYIEIVFLKAINRE